MKFFLPLLLAALTQSSTAQEVTSLHGSGTTNPQKCYWDIMDTLMKQSKQPLRLTYRGVGSSTGQAEFLGDAAFTPDNDFGSGDLPLSDEQYNGITGAGVEMVHLPIMMGAIGFFHSAPTGGKNLNLNPCLIAKIFDRKIVDWGDQEILDVNDGLTFPSPSPIKIARRVKGSSSTSSITKYLHKTCPEDWPAELVGKTVAWKQDTMPCEGSGGMTTCIRENPGTIGYIDAGHGHSEGLDEIDLKNANGEYLSSKEASERDGILAAFLAPDNGVPAELDQSFANVQLLNQPGSHTWPIVAMTYIFVRKDLSYLPEKSQKLLKAFLKSLYKEQYISGCRDNFGFVPVGLIDGDLKTKALTAINELITSPNVEEWYFEESTEVGVGQKDSVFSIKRDSYSEIEQDSLVKQIKALQAQIDAMKNEGDDHSHDDATQAPKGGLVAFAEQEMQEFDRDDELTAALAMSIVSITLWVFVSICFVVKVVLKI